MNLTVKEASEILKITERAVKKNSLSGKYQYHYEDGVGRGGKRLLISLESLPQGAQDRYNGIAMYSNTFTDRNGKLLEYIGKDVQVKYDGDDMETVYIFETDGTFICKAFPKLHSPFRGVNEEDYIRAGKERKNIRKLLRENQPKRLKDENEYLFSYIAHEHIRQQNSLEQIENDSIKEAEKAVSDTEQKERFNPFAEMYDACHKKRVI